MSLPHSTPPKPSSSRQMLSQGSMHSDTPPQSQDELKKKMARELDGATWEMDGDRLARVLSYKTRKLPLKPHQVDELSNYTVELGNLGSVLGRALNAFRPANEPPTSSAEDGHYDYLLETLDHAFKTCRDAMPDKSQKRFYSRLHFFTRGTQPMADGVYGANPLKPDVVGVCAKKAPKRLWWRPQSGKREDTAELPIEVKGNWPELVNQAATYARCLFAASPLRAFSLVLGYNHKEHVLRFLVFHRGGLTASTEISLLKISQPGEHQTSLLKLVLSLLTWRHRGDAGLPRWSDDREMFLPFSLGDKVGTRLKREGSLMETLCVKGRAPHVWKVKADDGQGMEGVQKTNTVTLDRSRALASHPQPRTTPSNSLSPPPQPHTPSSISPPHSHGGRKSDRLVEQKFKALKDETARTEAARITAFPQDYGPIEFVPQNPLFTTEIKHGQAGTSLVVKFSWPRHASAKTEQDMLQSSKNLFGVMTHHFSSIVHHVDSVPATNHLFLEQPYAAKWKVYNHPDDVYVPDLRALWLHASGYAGDTLLKAETAKEFFVALFHNVMGYRNLIEKGFQHRDISISNALYYSKAQKRVEATACIGSQLPPSSKLRELVNSLGIADACKGFIIDMDQGANFTRPSYFTEERLGARSGTWEFMSDDLLDSIRRNRQYLHSPVDDLWSFFYVAQWVAVFHRPDPSLELRELQELLRSDRQAERALCSMRLFHGPTSKRSERLYGSSLVERAAVLSRWEAKLKDLTTEWMDVTDELTGEANWVNLFVEYSDRGAYDLLQIIEQAFPGALGEVRLDT